MGRKMVGAVHTDEPHEYIYDSKAESLGQGVTVTVESDYYSSSTPTNVINTSTSTENTTPTTTNVVDPGGSSSTPTPTRVRVLAHHTIHLTVVDQVVAVVAEDTVINYDKT